MSVARQDTEMPYSMEKPSTKKRHDDGSREDHRPTAKSHIFFFSLLFLFLAFIWSYQTVCIYFVVTSPRLTSVRHFFSVPLSEYWILKSTSYYHRYFHSCWNVNCYSNKTTTQKKKEKSQKENVENAKSTKFVFEEMICLFGCRIFSAWPVSLFLLPTITVLMVNDSLVKAPAAPPMDLILFG